MAPELQAGRLTSLLTLSRKEERRGRAALRASWEDEVSTDPDVVCAPADCPASHRRPGHECPPAAAVRERVYFL
eukprot:scaffold301_cov243-Pinguiococcus_pyrenoidosus.AAC.21